MKARPPLAMLFTACALLLSPVSAAGSSTRVKKCGQQSAGGFAEQRIRVSGTNCATGRMVARAWIDRVEAKRCSRFHCRVNGFHCRISRPRLPFTTTCTKGRRQVRWDIPE
jgi:hypothetical protein